MKNKRIFLCYGLIILLMAIFLSQYTTSYSHLSLLLLATFPIFHFVQKNSAVKESDPVYVKHTIFTLLKFFLMASVYYVLLRSTTTYSHPTFTFVMIFVIIGLSKLWSKLPLVRNEKIILILTVAMIYGLFFFETWQEQPVSTFEYYHQELSQVEDYQALKELMDHQKDPNFDEEDFEKLLSYQDAPAMGFQNPSFIEMWDGSLLKLNLFRDSRSNDILIHHIEWLPEEVAHHFREFPPELVRAPLDDLDAESHPIIAARGSFVQEGHHYHRMLWKDELSSIFGSKKVWDSLWDEFDSLQPPEGPVIGSGTHPDGYIYLRFREDWDEDLELIDEIYEVFKSYASDKGIDELPMLFLQDES